MRPEPALRSTNGEPLVRLPKRDHGATPGASVVLAAGCERPSEGNLSPGATAAPPLARVEVVRPERQTVRRPVAVPGQLVAYETTAIHAKIPGYVKRWTANIGDEVKKGQVLAELLVHRRRRKITRADERAIRQVMSPSRPSPRAACGGPGGHIDRVEADLAAGSRRNVQRSGARAQTGSLLDETKNKLRSSEASREEVRAQVKTAEVAVTQSRAALAQARSDVIGSSLSRLAG